MKAKLLSIFNAIRDRISSSSDEELPSHLTQGLLDVCDLMKKHPDAFVERVPQNMLQDVLRNVRSLLVVERDVGEQDTNRTRRPREISENENVIPGDDPTSCSPQTREPTIRHFEEFPQSEDLLHSSTKLVASADAKSVVSVNVELEPTTRLPPHSMPKHCTSESLPAVHSLSMTAANAGSAEPIEAGGFSDDPGALFDSSSEETSSVDSWYSTYSSVSERPLIDQKFELTSPLPYVTAGTNLQHGEEETRSPVSESTASADESSHSPSAVTVDDDVDGRLSSKEGDAQYAAFDRKDYRVVGQLLHCAVCEMNVYNINAHHIKSEAHRRRLKAAMNAPEPTKKQPPMWQVTVAGFMRCNPCRKKFCIRSAHSSGDMHQRSKEYKTSEYVRDLKRRVYALWKKLPARVFDDLLTLRLADDGGARSFCVGCDEHFDSPAERKRHELRSVRHRACVLLLKKCNIFSYAFGILSKGNAQRCSLKYCVLCKIGVSNFIEYDNHVHGANSQHSTRLRTFWTKAFPQLAESGLVNAFHPPVKDTARYSLDVPLELQVNYFESLLHVIVISTDGFSLCSLCDQYVCAKSMKAHCDSAKHSRMQHSFLNSFRQSYKHSGIIKKNDMVYCVLCHIGFSNSVEAAVHMNSTRPHLERVELFGRLFARFIKTVVFS